jgi:hypothetical protein
MKGEPAMRLGLGLVISIVFAVACYMIAKGKGRGPVLWGVLGFFFRIITLIVILILPRKNG